MRFFGLRPQNDKNLIPRESGDFFVQKTCGRDLEMGIKYIFYKF